MGASNERDTSGSARSTPRVGILLPLNERQMAGATAGWADLLAMARRAEEVGFNSVWLADHLLFRFGTRAIGQRECWSLLAALAAATERVELGTIVLCTAFRNPALLAKMADTVDEISGGRLILGLGAGWHEPEYQAYGIPFDHRVARFEEALAIIHGLLRHGHVDFAGRYYEARDCELRPRGPQAGCLPILIGTTGPRMLRLTAQYADAWNVAWCLPDALWAEQAAVDAACAEAGRDPATLERTVGVRLDLPGPRRPPFGFFGGQATGSPEELAALLRSYARVGIGHVQICLGPNTPAGVEGFAPVLELLDGG